MKTWFYLFIFKVIRVRFMFVKNFACSFELDSFIIKSIQARLVFGTFKLNKFIREHIIKFVREHIIKFVREQNIFNIYLKHISK